MPTEVNDTMDIRLEPNILSGNDVLTVNGLAKSFGSQTLFTDLNFDVKRGERVAIIGDNGTGKTTILKIINGLVEPDDGEIILGSRVHIGYYDQDHQVLELREEHGGHAGSLFPAQAVFAHFRKAGFCLGFRQARRCVLQHAFLPFFDLGKEAHDC